MASPVNPPRGMRDFLPADKAHRERVLGVIRNVYTSHGFDEIETPVMEDSARLHAGLGGDNEKLAFGVLKRGLTAQDLTAASDPLDLADLGLRFDLTVPLARFYASHRGELPGVFRAIQIAPVWRAERPQKGRYRQFLQCDIDIIGEAGPLAEVELITATVATLGALGLDGCSIRINDRRMLAGMLTALGFAASDHDAVVITIDKLDKIGHGGVVAELRDRGFSPSAVDALHDFLTRPHDASRATPARGTTSPETPAHPVPLPFGAESITTALPAGVDPALVLQLAEVGLAVLAAAGGAAGASSGVELVFDPFLVRGMGYYTGTIFEIAHPSSTSSLGGGGRYDGMIGRFLGVDVPAAGFSIGFERIVDLVELPPEEGTDAVALVHDADVAPATLVALKYALVARGGRVRLERRPRNLKPVLAQLAASGYTRFATVNASTAGVDELVFRDLA
ncbi:MAG: histidine--tRNA ligase [Microbacteriaceae bacterium]|nr:histidine--tRNA ligase [Microbacteriaceae bacterium]